MRVHLSATSLNLPHLAIHHSLQLNSKAYCSTLQTSTDLKKLILSDFKGEKNDNDHSSIHNLIWMELIMSP